VTWPAVDALKQQIPLLDYLNPRIGNPPGAFPAGGSWDCVRCTPSSSQLSAGPCQESFLLLRLRAWRRSHSLRRTVLRRGIPRRDDNAALTQSTISAERGGQFLPDATSSSPGGGPLLTAARNTTAANYRGVSYCVCSGPLSAVLADDFGALALRPPASRPGEHRRLRHLQSACGVPLEANLYGRSIGNAAAHRFLPGAKGGLYAWERVKQSPEIILVEGLFDPAVLWQAGFRNVTCAIGSHLNARQFQQGVTALRVELPDGHDPNSFFARGGDGRQFQHLLEQATP
jgi:hypothetical protein